jgi:hypothetical protein
MSEPKILADMFTVSELDLLLRGAVILAARDENRIPEITSVQWDLLDRAVHYAANAYPPVDPDEDAGPVVVLAGNPVDGFTVHGPAVPNSPELENFCETRPMANDTWWLAPIQPIPALPALPLEPRG